MNAALRAGFTLVIYMQRNACGDAMRLDPREGRPIPVEYGYFLLRQTQLGLRVVNETPVLSAIIDNCFLLSLSASPEIGTDPRKSVLHT